MPQTHDLGPYFVHRISLEPGTSVLHRAPTTEIEEPYRHSNSVVVRLFRRFGVVFGRWRTINRTEEQALLMALAGHKVEDYDPENPYPRTDPAPEDEDRQEGEDVGRGVPHA